MGCRQPAPLAWSVAELAIEEERTLPLLALVKWQEMCARIYGLISIRGSLLDALFSEFSFRFRCQAKGIPVLDLHAR